MSGIPSNPKQIYPWIGAKPMLRSLPPTSSQRLSVTDIVADDIERHPFGHLLSIPDGFHSTRYGEHDWLLLRGVAFR